MNEGMRRNKNEKKNNYMNEEMLCGGCMRTEYKCHGMCTSAGQKFLGMMLLTKVLVVILRIKMTLFIRMNHS